MAWWMWPLLAWLPLTAVVTLSWRWATQDPRGAQRRTREHADELGGQPWPDRGGGLTPLSSPPLSLSGHHEAPPDPGSRLAQEDS